MSDIGKRLKEERVRTGLSQAQFGELGGVGVQAQGAYERGDRSPDTAYLTKVSEAVGSVDVAYIVTGNKSEHMVAEEPGVYEAKKREPIPFDPKVAQYAAKVTGVLYETFNIPESVRASMVPMVYSLLMGGHESAEDIVGMFDDLLPWERKEK